jgi:hypothetical protein
MGTGRRCREKKRFRGKWIRKIRMRSCRKMSVSTVLISNLASHLQVLSLASPKRTSRLDALAHPLKQVSFWFDLMHVILV